jgi:hypothetical protein
MSTANNEPETLDLDKATVIRDDDGRPVLMIGLIATVYFEKGWTRPVREAVAEVADEYLDKFRDHIRWAKHPTSASIYPITSKRIRRPKEWLPQHEDGDEWYFGYHGGSSKYSASEYQIYAASFEELPKRPKAACLSLHLPLTYFAEHGGTFAEFLRPICQRIKPISGIAGIGVLEMLDLYEAGKVAPHVRKLGERFPGLEIHSGVTRNHMLEGIKGVNWLTILGDRWIQEMGGLDYLRIRLDEPTFPFYPYDGGVIIQAGPRPQLGDAERNLWPKNYITLHKVLKKIQINDHYAFDFQIPGIPGEMDLAASRAWIFRFDGK